MASAPSKHPHEEYKENFYTKHTAVLGVYVDLQRFVLAISSLVFLPMPFIPVFFVSLNWCDVGVSFLLFLMGGLPSHIYFFYLNHIYYRRRKALDQGEKTLEHFEKDPMPLISSRRILTGGREIHSMHHCNITDWRQFINQFVQARKKFWAWVKKTWRGFWQWCGRTCCGRKGKDGRDPDPEHGGEGANHPGWSEEGHVSPARKHSTAETSSASQHPRESQDSHSVSSEAESSTPINSNKK